MIGGRAVRRVRGRLTLARRRRCWRRHHPMAPWSPVCVRYQGSDTLAEDGTIVAGDEFVEYAWRCAIHDKQPPPPKRFDITIDLCR